MGRTVRVNAFLLATGNGGTQWVPKPEDPGKLPKEIFAGNPAYRSSF
jgi:hypothetical protein